MDVNLVFSLGFGAFQAPEASAHSLPSSPGAVVLGVVGED